MTRDTPDASELITALEEEMRKSLAEINLNSATESNVTLSLVSNWFFDTEKLTRVIGNITTNTMFQPINQLRYAGHHILKSQLSEDPVAKKNNLIEAYKHCKRGYYDALDIFTHKLAEDYRELTLYVDKQTIEPITAQMKDLLRTITIARITTPDRITYYQTIHSVLCKGLNVLHALNEELRKAGFSRDLYTNKQELLQEIANLRISNTQLAFENRRLQNRAVDIVAAVSLAVAVLAALATAIGLTADAWLPSRLLHTFEATTAPQNGITDPAIGLQAPLQPAILEPEPDLPPNTQAANEQAESAPP